MLPHFKQSSDSKVNLDKVFVAEDGLHFLGGLGLLHYKIFNQFAMEQNPYKISRGKLLLRQIQLKNQKRQLKESKSPRFEQLHWQSPRANYYSRFKYLFQQQLEISKLSLKASSQDKIQLKQIKRASWNDLSRQIKEMVHLGQKVHLKRINVLKRSQLVDKRIAEFGLRRKHLQQCSEVSCSLLEKVKSDLSRTAVEVQHQRNINSKLKKGQSYFSNILQTLNAKINSSKEYVSRLKGYRKFIANVTLDHRLSNQVHTAELLPATDNKIPSVKKIFPVIRSKKKLTKTFKNNSLIVSQSEKYLSLERGQKKSTKLSVNRVLQEIQGRLKEFTLKDKFF